MKKINKSLPPNKLTEYAAQNPSNNWNDFRNVNKSVDYNDTKKLVFQEQGGLCAFCEEKIIESHKQRLEHFHAKSDKHINHNWHNWALDWQNIIGVCLGGSDVDKTKHSLPANLSCDAYKDYLITQGILFENCEGYLLNPLNIPANPCLFNFDRRTGELKANDNYSGIEFENNKYSSTKELIEKTIEYLNLNCDRLNQQRLALLNQYNQEIAKARKNNDKEIFKRLTERWFRQQWLNFFTTRRILLASHAETYLASINY